MATRGKKYLEAKGKVDRGKRHELEEGVKLLLEAACAKFDEGVDLAIRLGVDPKKADQMVRGTVVLPHGTGKKVRVLVFAKGQKEKEAFDAGADFVGGEDFIEKISKGWLEFDKAIATPDMMGLVSKLGKILGPRGLMPNPKVGTVTFDLERAVKEIKAGKVEFKVEKAGVVHVPVGKVSFGFSRLSENIKTLLEVILRAKPPTSKGIYLRSIALSTTMGPGIKIDPLDVRNVLKS
ncbi:MAG: 50S ribosomal protein L1 [Deltaproteobacteria bacterium CG_4_8_14_3_um_filter_45_9]|jgi:large subunit ribosomal protein L1|nr:MAG: 50S ribosomal protein L1 [Deltaproteobacteria bacterium CG03_land_8_20_14_0_80_45_14]PIX26561.1 MAG: 50S ribosomal protein L1 [Deltaproteobacteria bacterium CG_4_8_14_3_um_filter_45_9]